MANPNRIGEASRPVAPGVKLGTSTALRTARSGPVAGSASATKPRPRPMNPGGLGPPPRPDPRPMGPPNTQHPPNPGPPPPIDLHGFQPNDRIPIIGRADPRASRYYGRMLPRAQAIVNAGQQAQPGTPAPPSGPIYSPPMPPTPKPLPTDMRPKPSPYGDPGPLPPVYAQAPPSLTGVMGALGLDRKGIRDGYPDVAQTGTSFIPAHNSDQGLATQAQTQFAPPGGTPPQAALSVGGGQPPQPSQQATPAAGSVLQTQTAPNQLAAPQNLGVPAGQQPQAQAGQPVQQPAPPPKDPSQLQIGESQETPHGTMYRAPDGQVRVKLNEQGQQVFQQRVVAKRAQFRPHPWSSDPRAPQRMVVPGKPDIDPFTWHSSTDEWIN